MRLSLIIFLSIFGLRCLGDPPKSLRGKVFRISALNVPNPALSAETEIMTEAYSRLGARMNVIKLPARRALHDANTGLYDGELYRVAEVAKEFPNLRKVPTPIGTINFTAYGQKKLINRIQTWDSLRPYRLGAQLGSKYIEYNTKGMNINLVSSADQLLRMLYNGRVDIILMDRNTMLTAQRQQQSSGNVELLKDLVELKTLKTEFLYHYLHFKNEDIIPLLDVQVKQLTEEGFVKKSWIKAETEVALPTAPNKSF